MEVICISSDDEDAKVPIKSTTRKRRTTKKNSQKNGISKKTSMDKKITAANTTYRKLSARKNVDINQIKITEFFTFVKHPSSYFDTFDQSIPFLENTNKTKSNLKSNSVPVRVPVTIPEITPTTYETVTNSESIINQPELDLNSIINESRVNINSLINELTSEIQTPIINGSSILTNGNKIIEKQNSNETETTINKVKKKAKKKGICPPYKVVEGTNFAVDGFKYGDIEGVTTYFLTHFHSDHYIGLKKDFNKPLYVSEITGRLVKEFIKVNDDYIHSVPINTVFEVDNVEIIALEANHCPGAVMFFFKLPNGECILHTGDFRADPFMEHYPVFWNNYISTIYLDTTYLSKKYDFQSQSESLKQALFECKKFLRKNIGEKALIVCGTYVIGKEKVWMEIAQGFNLKVWLEASRRKAIDTYNDPMIMKYIVDLPEDAQIHVIGLGHIQYKFLSEYLDKFSDRFTCLLALRPSGWELNTKPSYGRRISIVGIEYSEHSSYNELKRFVKYLQPKKVISTVPKSQNSFKTPKVPSDWLSQNVKPFRKGYQSSITNFVSDCKKF